MMKVKVFIFTLFLASVTIAFGSGRLMIENDIYFKALLMYWIFSNLYFHLRITSKSGNSSIDYGINYSLSIGIFAGPMGLLIYETLHRFTVYFNKKRTKTADPTEFIDTFYNIGAFTLNYSIAFYLFQHLYPSFHTIPFGFWILIFLLVGITALLSDIYLITLLFFEGEIKTRQDAINFIRNRNLLDMGKLALTNGLLLLFLQEQRWEILLCLFILNYLVSRSFVFKAHNIKNKTERDQFEQMAYTDFLTGVFNRAYMDKKMTELNATGEFIGIVVCDIDKFKSINDNYNHAVGDKVIQHFATTLKSYLNKDDLLFRSGGEEFTLLLRDKSFVQSLEMIEKIRLGVEKSVVEVEYKMEHQSISYTASFGLYYYKVNEHLPMEKGYIFADQLMLQSKQLGKNRVSVKNGLVD
jgi:diguanylate cyclase (GGDEF)-like protein